MKSKYILAAILALCIVALAGVSPAFAVNYSSYLEINNTPSGLVIFTFSTHTDYGDYDGRDIDTIEVSYYLVDGGATTEYPVEPTVKIFTPNRVMLIFQNVEFPVSADPSDDFTYVSGVLTTGEVFDAYGPGFGWANIH